MPGLQVLSAPINQPTLSPTVQNKPVQPTIAPKVISAPQQPVLAPKVVTPQQPSIAPQVQNKPQGQGKITTIGTATEQRPSVTLTLDEFAQKIKQKYPEYADRDNKELAQAMLSKFPQYQDRVYIPVAESKPSLGGFL